MRLPRSASPAPSPPIVDLAFRAAYRVAFRLALTWWFVRRPYHEGALVALWHGGEVLAVRTSYRGGMWSFPGGGIGRGEAPVDAARREAEEEVGLRLAPEALHLAIDHASRWQYRLDRVRIFEARLAQRPLVRIDGREIVDARWFSAENLAAQPLPPHVRAYLETLTSSPAAVDRPAADERSYAPAP